MKRFLFLTALTPASHQTPLRKELFKVYLKCLKMQTCSDWQVLIIGEEDAKEDNIRFISSSAVKKRDKLSIAWEMVERNHNKPEFVIRLDDDDIISPVILEQIIHLNFDCYADKHHAFYHLADGKISLQKRKWLPNTVIHRYEHASALFGAEGIPLILHDHSQSWHQYYKGKKILFAPKKNPVYLRVISPTSITGGNTKEQQNLINTVQTEEYENYLKGFGRWKHDALMDYQHAVTELRTSWENLQEKE